MDVQPHLLNLSAYINQNLEKDLPLSILAKRVGLSPFHFHRKFGAYFGESLHQHIKRLRLERAAFSLIHGSSPVRQIARDSGYKTVSAFSHAFSGFAGESPTRYRSLAVVNGAPAKEREAPRLEPDWIGEMPAREYGFLRAMGSGSDVHRSIADAVGLLMKLVGPLLSSAPHDGAETNGSSTHGSTAHGSTTDSDSAADGGRAFECVAATSDVYGITKGADFRIDVGIDARRIAPERSGLLGKQTLPGGRYARFDVRCRAGELMTACGGISLRGLQVLGETPRLSQYFVRFSEKAEDNAEGLDDFQLFVPLVG